jgi:hypothetical protein
MTIASRRAPCTRRGPENHEPAPQSEDVVARYLDRESDAARATAHLCGLAADRAQAKGRSLVAGVLNDFAAELENEAALLAPTARPGIRSPRRAKPPEHDIDLENGLNIVGQALRHSERALRSISTRPDLPSSAATTFAAMASAHRARQRLLDVCIEIDTL